MVSGSGFHFPWNSASRSASPTALPEGEPLEASAPITGGAVHPADKSVNFLPALLAKFLTWITGKFGETMMSEDVDHYLDVVFPEENWARKAVSITTVADAGEAPPGAVKGLKRTLIWREHQAEGEKHIVTDTCHDMPTNTPILESLQAAPFSVAECLFHVCESHPEGKINVQIPVHQSCPFFFGYREHFVLLDVSVENGRVTRASVIDSKGKFTGLGYDGAHHLFAQLRSYPDFPFESRDDFTITTRQLGDQYVLNLCDCGRYAVVHASQLTPGNPSGYRPINEGDFRSWCSRVQAEVDEIAAKEKAKPLPPLDANE